MLAVVVIFALATHASTPTSSGEAESGSLASCASSISDTSASNSGAVKFSDCASSGTGNPAADAGATLPISYNLSSLSGAVKYVSPTGSDTSGDGSVGSPYATLAKAISVSSSGGNIVLRGGLYRGQGSMTISKSLAIIAYPGETPVFSGSATVSGGWTAAGSLSYRSYTPIPVTTGSGINFSACQNQTSSCVGQYPDQVWQGGSQLQQVSSQGAVTAGKFWVDETNNRLYMATSDVDNGGIEVSDQRKFASILAPNVTLKGFKVIRYSNTASDYGVISSVGTADNELMQDMYISDTSFLAVNFGPSGTSDLNEHSTIKDSTIQYSNWMGVSALATNYFTLDHDDVSNMNQLNEFTSSPQSGSLKTSRTWYTTVKNSKITNDNTVGIWFDQSNYKVTVANNYFQGNTGANIFFEISDFLYAVNNFIDARGSLNGIEMSGSTDTYVVNNTIIGGQDTVASYIDSRSIAGCSTGANGSCGPSSSDIDNYHTHQATLTWIPTINLVLNNIISRPDGVRYCGTSSTFCMTYTRSETSETLNTLIHKADASNNIPQTLFDGNVMANGSGLVMNIPSYGTYTSLSAFSSAMAGSPVSISGFEVHGLVGNQYVNTDGSPTSALSSQESNAAAVPTDSYINPYVPAGTKHYGVTWQ